MDLGSTIKKIRQQHGIKQKDLAKRSGVSPTYLSQIEGNLKEPNIGTLRTIAGQLEIPLPILFFLSMTSEDINPDKVDHFEKLAPAIKGLISEFFMTRTKAT